MSEYSRHGVSTVNGSGSIGFVSVFLLDSYTARVEMVGVVCRVQLTRQRLVIYTRLIAQAVARSDELRAEPQRADVHNYPCFFFKKGSARPWRPWRLQRESLEFLPVK